MLGKWRTPLAFLLFAAFFLALVHGSPASASTGQIKGTLTDAETGDPVVGASVLLVGTQRGAMTDFDGRFEIYQVEIGTYRLRVSHVEYNTVEITDVEVSTGLTTEVNQELEKKASDIGVTIEVKAKKDIIEKFEVSNTTSIDKATIESAPVNTVDDLLNQVAGVVRSTTGEVFIRGGRSDEVAYIVDGVPINDAVGGGQAGANLSLVSGSIQELQIIKDGFDPEYGDALSGIVNITTQTGSKDNTRLSFQYITDDFGNESLNKYSRDSDFMRFSISGPDPLFKNKILPALGINFLKDREFTYYVYAEVDKNDGVFQYDSYDTPLTRRRFDNLMVAGFEVPDRLFNKYYWMANLMFRPQPNMKFILSYKDQSTKETLGILDGFWDFRYSSETAPIQEVRWRSLSLEINQAVTKTTNYEVVLSYSELGNVRKPGDPNNPGNGLDPDQFFYDYEWESFEDRNNNGVYDAPEPVINLFPDTASYYGENLSGPEYTHGEFLFENNIQGAEISQSGFRFNNNGIVDNLEGEPFYDINGNGVRDSGDFLRDRNGNGVLDEPRMSTVNQRNPETFIDGDSIIGEPFTDLNSNGVYDRGVDLFVRSSGPENMDLNHNGKYDGPLDQWTVGVPFYDRNGNGVYDRPNNSYDPGEPFFDKNGNGQWDAGGTANFLDPGAHREDAVWRNWETQTYRGELKIIKELGRHQLKGGVALKIEDLSYQRIEKPYLEYNGIPDGGPFPDRGAFRDIWSYTPWGGTVYFRDKLEYGSMIASLGFRWDFFIQDTDDLIEVARNDELGSGVIFGDRQKFAPRIGFSYPISDKAKVHFNYGHFFQRPALTRFYARNTTSVDQNQIIGNYNLDYKKTVQYSFGVKYAMSENYAIDVSGYFKDEFDKVNSQQVRIGERNGAGGLTFQQFRNSDYGRSRGFEVELTKRGGGYVNGQVNYTYAFAFGKASQTNENYLDDFLLSREPLSEAPLDNDVRHALKAAIQVFVPGTVKPRLFGLPIPNGWSLAVETFIESGRPFTPSNLFPGISSTAGEELQRNSLRKPSIVNFDVRFTKDFGVAGLDYKFILWVENVFDNKNVVSVYSATGRPDTQQNQAGIIKGGTDYDLDPSNWDYGRQIRVGLELNI